MPVLSKRIVLDCFYLLVFYSYEKMSICSSTPQHGGYTDSSLLEGDVKVRKCHVMLFLRTCMSQKWMISTISFKVTAEIEIRKHTFCIVLRRRCVSAL